MELHFDIATSKLIKQEESKIFFKQWIRSPAKLGTFAPVSTKLANLVVRNIDFTTNPLIVEIGAGTGRISRSLLNAGINPRNLFMVELDEQLVGFLKKSLVTVYQEDIDKHVIKGDASNIHSLLPNELIGKIDYVVSAIPLMYMDEESREEIITTSLNVLKPKTGFILHVSYSPISPVKFMSNDLIQNCLTSLWNNIPPGFIWKFIPKYYFQKLSA